MADVVNLAEKFATFSEHWAPRLVASYNGNDIRIVKVEGAFVWHVHEDTDDFFLVLDGVLERHPGLRGASVELGAGWVPELLRRLDWVVKHWSRNDANLQALRPGEDWSGSERFEGQEGLGLGDGTGVLQDIADLDALADQLSQSHQGAALDDIDLDALGRQLRSEEHTSELQSH